MESFCPGFKTLNCHLSLSNGSAAISSPAIRFVKIHNATSAQLPTTCQVPQGSILGPLLFSTYTNDLLSILRHSSPQCYVDDTKVILNFNLQDQVNAITKLNEDLCRISNWTFRNQLLVNPSKTILIIIFGTRAMVSKVEDFRRNLLGKENSTGCRC